MSAALSGLLMALAYPAWDQSWLIWLALTPLIAAVWFSPRPARRAWLHYSKLGYITGFVFFTITFRWLGAPLAHLFGNPWLVCLPPLLALYLALFVAFWAWFISLLPGTDTAFLTSGRNIRIASLAACAWVAQEWVRGWLFGGFGWNGLGIALHQNIALIQIADITGVPGLSFLVAFANVIALITVRRFAAEAHRGKLRPHWDFSTMMLLVIGAFTYGVHALQHPTEDTGKAVPLKIAALQPDIPESFKSGQEHLREIFDRYDQLTHFALATHPQLLIWPEAATLTDLFDADTFAYLKSVSASTDAAFLLGSFESPPDGGDYNIAACITRHGGKVQTYRKMHLVPFGEYIPLRHSFPLFAAIAGQLVPNDLRAGTEYTAFQLDAPQLRAGPLICFEDTDGDHTRHFVGGAGAQLLVNITNDSWFGHSPGSAQHLANAIFRTVENRRPLVRSANTGITCIVDCEGRVRRTLTDALGSTFLQGFLIGDAQVPTTGPLTFYTQHGEWVAHAATAIALLSIAIHFLKMRARRPSASVAQ